MYITICEIDASPSSMHETGHSKPVNCNNPEGWDGEASGNVIWDGRIHVHL